MTMPKRNSRKKFQIITVLKNRFFLFSGVGFSGLILQISTLAFIHRVLNLPFLLAQSMSILVAMTSNYALNNTITFRERRLRGSAWFSGLLSFCLACSIGALFNLMAAQLVFKLSAQWILAGLTGTVVGSIFNFVSVDRFTWKTARQTAQPVQPAGRSHNR